MAPIAFTDSELGVLRDAAAPIRPVDRPAFFRAVAAAIGSPPPEGVGVGRLHKIAFGVRRLQFNDKLQFRI
jgi:hypothetical protein